MIIAMEAEKKSYFLLAVPQIGPIVSTDFFFFICSRWKIKYILFKKAYPDIFINVLYCD